MFFFFYRKPYERVRHVDDVMQGLATVANMKSLFLDQWGLRDKRTRSSEAKQRFVMKSMERNLGKILGIIHQEV